MGSRLIRRRALAAVTAIGVVALVLVVLWSSQEDAEGLPEVVAAAESAPFTVSPPDPHVGEAITLVASPEACGVPDCVYAWEVDGVPVGTGRSITHTFTEAGTKSVKLAVDGSATEPLAVEEGQRPAPVTVTVVATGDAVCSENRPVTASSCRHQAVGDRVLALDPDAFIMAGDACYDDRAATNEPTTMACLEDAYDPAFGPLKARTLPVVGNHECYVAAAERCGAHYDYWGDLAGPRGQGYYARRIGEWLVVVLNTECGYVDGCHAGSPQERWLRQTLEADTGRCELIAMHKPLISSGHHGDNPTVAPLWKAAQDNGAELAVQGHDHHMERFGALTSTGAQSDAIGLRSFITGAGGKSHYPLGAVKPHSRFRNNTDFGVLELTLTPTDFSAAFISETGETLDERAPVPCR